MDLSSHPAIPNYPMLSSFDLFVIGGMVLCMGLQEKQLQA